MVNLVKIGVGFALGVAATLFFVTHAPALCRDVVVKDMQATASFVNASGQFMKPASVDFLTEISE